MGYREKLEIPVIEFTKVTYLGPGGNSGKCGGGQTGAVGSANITTACPTINDGTCTNDDQCTNDEGE